MNVKKLFNTPLKASLTIISLIAIFAILSTGTAFAAGAIAENSSIGAETAKNFAFADAGIDPTTVKEVQTEFEYEQGQFVYEVEFIADGTEYEYWINASDGTVVKKNLELVEMDSTNQATTAQITVEQAKGIALKDAKLTDNSVTFTTAKLDQEESTLVYELEFYAENVEYEYEINAITGAIYSKSKEIQNEQKPTAAAQQTAKSDSKENTAETKPNNTNSRTNDTKSVVSKEQAAANRITLDAAKAKALADAGVTASSVTYTQAELDYDDGVAVYDIEFYTSTHEYEYEINADSGKVHDKSIEALDHSTGSKDNKTNKADNKDSSGKYIGIDKAKTIAVNHAGLSISDITFSKAKLDTDDGKTVYEIEFYKGGIEYEYEIDASSGKILEYDSEQDD